MSENKAVNNGWSKRLSVVGIAAGLAGALFGHLSTIALSQGNVAITSQKLTDLHEEYKNLQIQIGANTLADGVTRIEVTNRLTALETQVLSLSKAVDKLTIAIETKR